MTVLLKHEGRIFEDQTVYATGLSERFNLATDPRLLFPLFRNARRKFHASHAIIVS